MSNFHQDLTAIARDLVETNGWSVEQVHDALKSKIVKMRDLTTKYGDGGRLRGGRDYLARIYQPAKNDHFDDLIADHIEQGCPWGVIFETLKEAEAALR